MGAVDQIEEEVSCIVNAIPTGLSYSHWILDFGATCHVFGNLRMFDTVSAYRRIKMPHGDSPGGRILSVNKFGQMCLTNLFFFFPSVIYKTDNKNMMAKPGCGLIWKLCNVLS